MNQCLSPSVLGEIRRNISQSLTDTFQIMFHLDVFLLPKNAPPQDSPMICAYMDMVHQKSKGTLSISMTQDLAQHIAVQLDPLNAHPSLAIIQDVVNEVDNIVANHVRTYLCSQVRGDLNISLPKAGMPPKREMSPQAINLHFRIRENDVVSLDFTYHPQTVPSSV